MEKTIPCIWFISPNVQKLLLTMKITIFLLFAGMLNILANDSYAQSTKVSLNMQNVSVEDVLNEIESKSEFYFLFNQKLVDVDRKVDIVADNTSIRDVLAGLFNESDIKFLVLDRQIILAPKDITGNMTEMQAIRITGKVIDASSGEPLPGVNILVEGTQQGVITGVDGTYSILVASASSVLLYSYVGYNTERVEVGAQVVIDVSLILDIKSLDEVVVIGYGTRAKKDITTAISTVSSKDIASLSSATAELAMQGRMAGVQVVSGGNTPTARPTIRIRGLNTWQSAEPLYVIDGVPVTEYGSGAEKRDPRVQDLRSPINIMSFINPDDIESISVLKDASSAAIYGVRAANGVILVTTKKGKEGKAVVEYSMNTGWQNIPKKFDVLSTPEMINFYQGSYAEAIKYKPTVTLPGIIDPTSAEYLEDDRTTYDWQTPYLNKNARVTSHQIRVSGGSEKVNYYVSGGYDFNESPFIQNNLKRYSIVTNLNAKISKYINTGVNLRVSYAKALTNHGWNGTPLQTMARIPAWQPIYDNTGTPYLNGYAPAMEISYGGIGDGIPQKLWDFSATKLWGPQTCTNEFGMMSTQNRSYSLLRNMGTMFVEVSPIEGLSIKGTVSGDWYTNLRSEFASINQMYFNITPADPTSYSFPKDSTISTQGTYGERQVRNTNLVYNATVHYAKSVGNHNIDFVFDYMNQNYRVDFTDASTNWIRSEKREFWTVGGPQGRVSGFTGWDKSALNGYMGRLSYDYNGKYYVAFTLRRDGTSKFAPDKRWGTFPALSAAWRISAEKFMGGLTFINDMKIRYGWGQLGNQETLAFPYLSKVNDYAKYSLGTGSNGMGNLIYGFSFPDFPNADLIWERTTSQNIAIDAILFNNSVDLTIEYYNKLTDGILQETRLPGSVGAWNPPVVNVGKVRNSGIEIALSYRGSYGDLNYMVGGNLTTNKNEVKALFNDSPLGGEGGRIEEGQPINYLWGYELGGILQSPEEVDAYTARLTNDTEGRSDIRPGDMWFVDQNGDSTLNIDDKVFLGQTLPGLFYGFNANLAYKGFDFSIVFTGIGKVKAYNYDRAALEATGTNLINLSRDVLDSWTLENLSTTMPRAVYEDPARNGRFSSRYVESAAYLRLSNAELGYTVPKTVTDKLKFASSLRVYVSGSNLFLITKWKGIDPENNGYPIPRIFRIGLNATF